MKGKFLFVLILTGISLNAGRMPFVTVTNAGTAENGDLAFFAYFKDQASAFVDLGKTVELDTSKDGSPYYIDLNCMGHTSAQQVLISAPKDNMVSAICHADGKITYTTA